MRNCLLLFASLLPLAAEPVSAQADGPIEVVVVTGRQPGPPLWRVIRGENVLYIFPTLSPVPEGIIWDPERVDYVLSQSQEVLLSPDIDADFSIKLLLNPVNLFRGMRLIKRLSTNPDEATLQQVLPPELFARYDALRARYTPRDRGPESLRPVFAGVSLSERILRDEGLVSDTEIIRQLERLIRRNRHLEETSIEATMDLTGSFREVASRAEAMMASLPREKELECFSQELSRVESELDAMKARANAWAQGYIDDFREIPLPGDDNDACVLLLFESSEFETLDQLRKELDARWIREAERALATNQSSFAILDIVELLRPDGPVAELRARGYEVREP